MPVHCHFLAVPRGPVILITSPRRALAEALIAAAVTAVTTEVCLLVWDFLTK
ncbi:hypothetical protein ABZ714_26705 [Streptomyces sp. NPDC006798]|uniref:hypothetical protein n=1 Tax=Streptomyces sp. NPDC006798 TaxID=3155462 RepID=UPI0033DA6779